jgi:hypothetical protein
MAQTSSSGSLFGWSITTLLIVVAGAPNIVPLLGVYAMMGGTTAGARGLMVVGLAATGIGVGLIQSAFIQDLRALLCTAPALFLGYLPAPLLIFVPGGGTPPFDTVCLIVAACAFCLVGASQWVLMRWRATAA